MLLNLSFGWQFVTGAARDDPWRFRFLFVLEAYVAYVVVLILTFFSSFSWRPFLIVPCCTWCSNRCCCIAAWRSYGNFYGFGAIRLCA